MPSAPVPNYGSECRRSTICGKHQSAAAKGSRRSSWEWLGMTPQWRPTRHKERDVSGTRPLGLDDYDSGETMNLWNKILLAAVMSWAYSVTLGLLSAVAASENHSLRTLLLPAVVPVALIGSTIVAIAITPVAFWSVRTGARNLWFYGPILWIVLAAYIVFVFRSEERR